MGNGARNTGEEAGESTGAKQRRIEDLTSQPQAIQDSASGPDHTHRIPSALNRDSRLGWTPSPMLGTHIPMSWETNEFGCVVNDIDLVDWRSRRCSSRTQYPDQQRRTVVLESQDGGSGAASRFIRYQEFRSRNPPTASDIPAPKVCCTSPPDRSEVSPPISFRGVHSDTCAPGN